MMNQIRKIQSRCQELLADSRGGGLVEYIILIGVVALICIAAFSFFGNEVSNKIDKQASTVSNINSGEGE